MSTAGNLTPTVVPPGAGRVIRAFGSEIIVHLGAAETGGAYTMFTVLTPPGGGVPPHYHEAEDEWFLVQEGRCEFLLNGAWTLAPVGTVAFLPRGVVHAFRNAGDAPLRLLVHTAPAGFEAFYARAAAEFVRPEPPDMNRLVQIAAEHGIHILPG